MSQNEVQQIQAAIDALEAQRAILGDAVVETALAPLREKLAAATLASAHPDERKRVTVLFADVSGYTAMSEDLDPEDAAAIMNALFEDLTAKIVHYGGTIDKYSGDAVMALFGAPKALESHEEMAVRAALAMQDAVSAFSARLERERGFSLRLRIGLNTGEVMAGMVGGLSSRSFTVMGDTVNLASRLEHACPVERVMISADTARPLHNVFDFEPPHQISVKGKTEPITVYVVVGEKAERGRVRGLADLHAPMIGREAELATLQNLFQKSLQQQEWQIVAVTGDAGIGKTRLRREFMAWVTEAYPQSRLLTSRCYAHTQPTPYHLVAGLVRTLFNVGEDMEAGAAGPTLMAGLRTLFPEGDETELSYQLGSLGRVLGLSLPDDPLDNLDPEQRRDRIFLSLERILLAASRFWSLLVVIEDLHWADALSTEFLQRLLQTLESGPEREHSAVIMAISRPPEETPWGALLRRLEEPPYLTLKLTPLDEIQSQQLITSLLDEGIPQRLLRLITEHVQGNPFFLEETLRSFIEEGALEHDAKNGRWRMTRDVDELEVPATVQGVLAARLDRLSADNKYLVKHAAIIGRVFWQRLLAEILTSKAAAQTAERVEDALLQVQNNRLVTRLNQSQFHDDWEWAFTHVLIQEVAYASVLKTVRREVHRQVAQWLEGQLDGGDVQGSPAALLPLTAYHFEQGEVWYKALAYLARAGAQAADQFANDDAIDYFSRALSLLQERREEIAPALNNGRLPQQQYELLLGREGVYRLIGERERQADDLIQLQVLADTLDDERRRLEVALRFAAYYESISEFAAAIMAAKQAVNWAERSADWPRKVEALINWARALWRQGIFEEARDRLNQALELARRYGDRAGEANSLHHLGTVLFYLGDYDGAREHLEQALALRQALGKLRGEADSLNNLFAIYDSLGDLEKAKACCEQALSIYRTIGNRRYEASALGNLATNHHALGEFRQALDYNKQAISLFHSLGDRGGESAAAGNLGLVLHSLGRYRRAKQYCRQSLDLARAIGDREGEGFSLTYLAMAAEGLGELETAATGYEEALQLRREIGQDSYAIDDLAGLARVAQQQGRLEQALAFAREALAWLEQHGVQGVEYPLRVYMTIADVLQANMQPARATAVLETANELLQQQAARISDPVARRAFLQQVPLHRRLRDRLAKVSA